MPGKRCSGATRRADTDDLRHAEAPSRSRSIAGRDFGSSRLLSAAGVANPIAILVDDLDRISRRCTDASNDDSPVFSGPVPSLHDLDLADLCQRRAGGPANAVAAEHEPANGQARDRPASAAARSAVSCMLLLGSAPPVGDLGPFECPLLLELAPAVPDVLISKRRDHRTLGEFGKRLRWKLNESKP
ncbi:MAG: hypothetical protein KBD01_06275 [Acidobacteria bacterium]|nr:hypothetical protein [Acidobacteriota bacterium]